MQANYTIAEIRRGALAQLVPPPRLALSTWIEATTRPTRQEPAAMISRVAALIT
jgi:hypothetical protein